MRHKTKKSTGTKKTIGKTLRNAAKGAAAGVKNALKAGVNCAVAEGASEAVTAVTGRRTAAPPRGQDAPAKWSEKGNPTASRGRTRRAGIAKKRASAGRSRRK